MGFLVARGLGIVLLVVTAFTGTRLGLDVVLFFLAVCSGKGFLNRHANGTATRFVTRLALILHCPSDGRLDIVAMLPRFTPDAVVIYHLGALFAAAPSAGKDCTGCRADGKAGMIRLEPAVTPLRRFHRRKLRKPVQPDWIAGQRLQYELVGGGLFGHQPGPTIGAVGGIGQDVPEEHVVNPME